MVHCLEEKKIKEGFFFRLFKRSSSTRFKPLLLSAFPSVKKEIMSTVLLSKKHVGIILLEDKKISYING